MSNKKYVFPLFVLCLLSIAAPAKAQDYFSDTDSVDAAVSDEISAGATADTVDEISSIDANGNMTVKAGKDYPSPINLTKGSLTVNMDGSVKSVQVTNGNVTLHDNTSILGNLVVTNGNLSIGSNVTISGSVTVGGTFSAKDNLAVSGPVSVGSTGVLTIGSNSDITNTLTSPGGLKIGSNADIKLFLSGKTAEIDGKVYKLGGTILSSGVNSDVGLPFVPKPKNGTPVTPTGTTAGSVQSAAQTTNTDASAETSAANIPDISDIVSADDINSYVSDVISNDENVKELNLSSEAVDLNYEMPASLFGIIPMSIPTRITVSKDKDVAVSYPWYSFLMAKNKKAVQDAVMESVGSSISSSPLGDDTTSGFSAKLQASITNSVLSALRNLF